MAVSSINYQMLHSDALASEFAAITDHSGLLGSIIGVAYEVSPLTFIPELNWSELTQTDLDNLSPSNGTFTIMSVADMQAEIGLSVPAPPCGSSHIVKVVTNAGATAFIDAVLASTIDITDGNFGTWVLYNDASLANMNSSNTMRFFASAGSNPGVDFNAYEIATILQSGAGWQLIGGNEEFLDQTGGTPDNTAVQSVRTNIRASSGQVVTAYFAPTFYAQKSRPNIMIEQDDGNADTDIFYEDLDSAGLLGSINIIAGNVDSPGNTSTAAVLNAAYAAGHEVYLHGVSDTLAATYGSTQSPYRIAKGSAVGADTYVDVYALGGASLLSDQIDFEVDFLTARGWTGNLDHVALPGGEIDEDVRKWFRDNGFKSVRHVGSNSQQGAIYGGAALDSNALRATTHTIANAATDLALIDDAITHGFSVCLYLHEYAANRSVFQTLLTGIASRLASDLITVTPRGSWKQGLR